MDPEKRLEIFALAVIVVAFAITFYGLPEWALDVVVDLGISFVLSGVFYAILKGFGLEFLEKVKIGFVSAMTVAVFVVKNLVV